MNLDFSKFSKEQKVILGTGLIKGLDVSVFANSDIPADCMKEALLAVEDGVDIAPFINKGYSANTIMGIRLAISRKSERYLDNLEDISSEDINLISDAILKARDIFNVIVYSSEGKLLERGVRWGDNHISLLNESVGGFIEYLSFSKEFSNRNIAAYINEEGKLKGLKPSMLLLREGKIVDVVVGNIVFTKVDEFGDEDKLSDSDISFITNFVSEHVQKVGMKNLDTGFEEVRSMLLVDLF